MTLSAALTAAELFVAESGSDANPGSFEAPFASLERARDEIRKMKAASKLPPEGVAVQVRGGFYALSKSFVLEAQDSGSPEAPIRYMGFKGEKPLLSGGAKIQPSAFKPVSDSNTLERLDASVRGQVLQASLQELGFPELKAYPLKFNGSPAIPELFFNDRRMTLARWPNEGWATVAKILSSGTEPGDPSGGKSLPSFEYSGDRPQRWRLEEGVWLLGYWSFDWSSEAIKVKAIDTAQRRIELAGNHWYGLKQGNPSPRRYRAVNLLEELDAPGEYYIDVKAKTLFFLPPAPMDGAKIVLSSLNAPLICVKGASDIVIQGFTLEASLGDGLAIKGGRSVSVQSCEVRNARVLGIDVDGGYAHRVEACDIHDTGEGGLRLKGGDRKTLEPARHEALNNHIWLFSIHKQTYANAIEMLGAGSRAAHNLIHDAPHQAVSVNGNDHIFEYNIVHDVCAETDDCGAFYKGRNPSCRGNILRFNFWYNIGSPMGHGNAAVYFDDGDGGELVFGNVFFRCGYPGRGSFGSIFSHGGHDILAENNVFIECKRALGSAPWNDARWRKAIMTDGKDGWNWQTKLLKDVDVTKPPYTVRYPELAGFMDPQPGQPRVNCAKRNLIAMCADISSGSWQLKPGENLVVGGDPGFVDAGHGDFRLKPDAEVFKALPGFQPIPFEKIGLYADALRPNPPAKNWTLGAPKPLPPLSKSAKSAPKTAPGAAGRAGAPVFKVQKADAGVALDAMPIAQDVIGSPAAPSRQSKAWLSYDQQALFVAVEIPLGPKPRIDGNEWSQDDAVEISLRPLRKDGKLNPISALRGYGNGFLQYGTTSSPDNEPSSMDPGSIKFKKSRSGDASWRAEFIIPFQMLDVDPASSPRIAFNITVRRAEEDLWLMWQATRGHSFDVDQAGVIELVK